MGEILRIHNRQKNMSRKYNKLDENPFAWFAIFTMILFIITAFFW